MKKKALIGLLALSMTLTTACGSKGSDDSKREDFEGKSH